MDQRQRQLVDACLRGDQAAMAALHGEHAPAVAAYYRRSGFGDADAEDLTQETFVRAFRAIKTFDPSRGALRTWLAAIARNVARRHWRRSAGPAEHFDMDLAEISLDVSPNAAMTAAKQEEIESLRECIRRLDGQLAEVIRLRYVQARTTRGIAEAMGLPEATVRLRLAEAMDRLGRCLKGKGVLS